MARRADRVGRKKPWRIPTAPRPRDWDGVLQELPTDLGLELYMLARQFRLVADCPAERREKLFPVTAGRHVAERRTEAIHEAPPSLRAEFRTLMRVTGRRPPEDQELAEACEVIATWAQDGGFPNTAVHFAESAAAILPKNPYFAFIAGRTNRLVGVPWRAEVFYTRAIRYAYRQLNWNVYVRAHLGFGRLLSDRGRIRAAAEHYYSAARVALDQGHDWLAAQTYHDLFPLYYELGDKERAHEFARMALETYPRHNERYPIAVHDFLLLLIFEGHFKEAWTLLELLVKAPLRPHDRVLIWGTVARTAGSLQLDDQFADAEARVLELAPHYDAFAPAAYLGLAAGAHALGDRSLADAYARKGIALADAKEDRQAKRLLEELLTELMSGNPTQPPAPPLSGEPADQLAELSTVIAAELASWRSDQTWTAKENQSGLWTLGAV